MGDYTKMAEYYDTIMLSGYYDYESIARNIEYLHSGSSLLEIGCGTGLILERLVKQTQLHSLTGIDLTGAMLDIAEKRLNGYGKVQLFEQNVVTLQLPELYDTAFSYGGPWYFSKRDDGLCFISHLPEHADNERSLENLSNHIRPGGSLLLGIQGPHYDYSKSISNGMTYSQKIIPTDEGFIKDYYLLNGEEVVMHQTLHYRVYPFEETVEMLSRYQLKYQPAKSTDDSLFMVFKKEKN